MHTTALCSPSRACIVTGRNHHSNGMALHHRVRHRLPGLQRDHAVRERDALGDAARARLRHVHGRQVAPHPERLRDAPPARTTAGRSGAASSASTASWAATRASGTPSSSTTTTRSSRRRRPEEGYHLTEDLVDKSIEFITDLRQIDPDKPFYLHLCFGATHAPHHVPKEWADRYAGQFDDGWDAYREKVFARQKELGILPPDAELSRHDPDVPEWDSLSRRGAPALRPDDGGLRGLPEPHRPSPRPAARLPARAGHARQHDRHGHLATTARAPRAARAGRRTRPQFFNNAQETLEESLAVIDEIGGPEHFNHYPVGLDAGPATRRSGAGSARRTGAARPTPSSCPGRRASGARRGPHASTRTSSTWCRRSSSLLGIEPPAAIRGVTQAPIEGVSFAHALDDPQRPAAAPHPVLRDARPPGDLQGRLASRLPVARPFVRRGGHRVRQPDLGRDADQARRHRLGALSRRRGPGREPRPRRRAPRQAHRAHRDVVRRGRQVQGDAGRRRGPSLGWSAEKPLVALPRDQYVYRPGHRSPSRTSPHRACTTGRTASPRRWTSPRAAPRASCSARERQRGGYSLYVKGGRLHYVHNYVARQRFTVSSPDRLPAGRHELRFEFEPTGQVDLPHGRGAPGGSSSTWTGPWSRTPTPRTRRRSCSTRAASAAATTRDLR